MKPRLLVFAFLCAVAAGVFLFYFQPWVEDIAPLSPQQCADEMNALAGSSSADAATRASKLTETVDGIYESLKFLDSAAVTNRGRAAVEADNSFPSASLTDVLTNPPVHEALARATLSGVAPFVGVLDDLATGPEAPTPWSGSTPIADQLAQRIVQNTPLHRTQRALWCRMRLAGLDGNSTECVSALRTSLWLAASIESGLTPDAVITAALCREGTLDELRLQILERRLPEPALAACEALLAARTPDDPGWKARISSIAKGYTLILQARPDEALAHRHLNSRINRRRLYGRWNSVIDDFTALAQLPPDQPTAQRAGLDRPLSPAPALAWSATQELDAVVDDLRNMMDTLARVLRQDRVRTSAIRVLIAIERYRLRHGEFPASLSALDSGTFSHPQPPLAGIVYRPGPDASFVLYCHGPDGVDNGGKFGTAWLASDGEDSSLTTVRAPRVP